MNNCSSTQQINSYLREQQIIRGFNSLLLALKKADRTRQDVSAFRTETINLNKVDYSNQSIQGTNQYGKL